MSARGTTNTNARGSAESRRRRKQWLLDTFGDGTTADCTLRVSVKCLLVVTFETITVDRIVPGIEGGRYVRGNIKPACGHCNSIDGIALREQRKQTLTGRLVPGMLVGCPPLT